MGGSSTQGEYQYLLMALVLVFMIGSISYIISSFTDVTLYNHETYTASIVDFVQYGYNFQIAIPIPILPDLNLDFPFNPFGILGGSIQNFIVLQLSALAFFPDFIAIPLIVIIASSFLYFLIKIIQGFIP